VKLSDSAAVRLPHGVHPQHIPVKGAHLIVYYDWYSNKSRPMRKKVDETAGCTKEVENAYTTIGAEEISSSSSRQSWGTPIKRVYEIDPCRIPKVETG